MLHLKSNVLIQMIQNELVLTRVAKTVTFRGSTLVISRSELFKIEHKLKIS